MEKGKLALYYQELKQAGLQELQESMSRALGLAALVTCPDGRPLTKISNLCAFCALLNTSAEGRARCARDRVLSARAVVEAGREVLHTCHAGLVHLAVPLRVAGEIAAVVIGGNVALKPLREKDVARLARETGLDPGELGAAAGAVPLWPEERLRAAMDLVRAVTDTVAGLVYARQELQRKVEELTALFEFSRTVSGTLRMTEAAHQALEAVLKLTGATSGSVVLLDEAAPTERETVATVESCHEFRVVPAGEIIAAVEREARAAHFNSRPEGLTPEERRPAVAVPLTVGGRVTGVLTIAGRPGGAPFTEDETVFLTTLGTSLGLALENARLFRALQARAAMLERLVEVGQVVSSSLDVDLVFEAALTSLKEFFGASWCALRLYDEKTGGMVLKAGGGPEKKEICDVALLRPAGSAACPLIDQVVRTKEPAVIEDINAAGLDLPCRFQGLEIEGIAIVPVLAKGELLGTLAVHSPVPRRWSEEEVGYLATLASQTGLALENARL